MRGTWKNGFSALAIAALLVQSPASARRTAPSVPPEQIQQRADGTLCHTPAPLPQLGQEDWQQQPPVPPRPYPMERGTADAAKGDVAMPSAPPPPPSSDSAEGDSRDIVVTGSTIDGGGRAKSSTGRAERSGEARRPDIMPPPRPWPRPRPQPQAGLLTAGEHDDLLNPELYADYVRRSNLGQAIPDLPRLDTARVLTVAVHDRAGRPVPFAPVELACADGSRLRLATTADGTVSFFPDVDRLGRDVWVRTGGEDWRAVAIPARRGAQRVDFTVQREAQAVRKLDLMLVIDTTGSMGDEIRYLASELASIVDALKARHQGIDLRVGFVFYRDLGDDYVTNTLPMTRDISAAQAELRQRWAGGGGDYPEAMEQALIRAAGQDWRPDAAKSLLLVADAPPHDENVGKAWLAAEHLRAKRVHVVPVAASGVADKAEYVMRAMAAATQSRYTFLTDDSGIGNRHAPPAIDCYLVTRLDALLRRVIDSQISGRRIEPEKQDVIRTVGQYDNGRCIIPRGGLQEQ